MNTEQHEKSKRLRIEWLGNVRTAMKLPHVQEHAPGFSENARRIFDYNVFLGMMTWREGRSPREFFEEAIDDILGYRTDLIARGMTTKYLHLDTVIFIASLLDRQSEFEVADCELDVCGDLFLDCHLAKRLQGLQADDAIQAGFAQLGRRKRHALAIRTYETYFHLLALNASSAEVEQSMAVADANYAARRKDTYYSGGPDINGGGDYNEEVVDYRLAAIMKYRGIDVESMHLWRW
jgi:hypothetical protein